MPGQQCSLSADARCFYRLEDWWTYELCYEKHVRQFHREKEVLSSEYSLGVYEGEPAETDTMQASMHWVHECICPWICMEGHSCQAPYQGRS